MGVRMHTPGRRRVSVGPESETLVGAFLLLFLQMAFVSSLQIVVNIGPKLLQLISKGVEAHLRSPV